MEERAEAQVAKSRGQDRRLTRRQEGKLRRDLKVLGTFIRIYCEGKHPSADREPVAVKHHDVERICGGPVALCPSCRKLFIHAWAKRTMCLMDPKPACKHCPNHCYAPHYRDEIREVMRYSGRKLVMSGRMDYLLHLLF